MRRAAPSAKAPHQRPSTQLIRHASAVVAFALGAGTTWAQAGQFRDTLLPKPSHVEVLDGQLALTPAFTVSSNASENAALQAATRRMLNRLEQQTNVPLSKTLLPAGGTGATLRITVAGAAQSRPALGVDESYTLTSDGKGIRLDAPTVFGALHGLFTLEQLVQARDGAFVLPAIRVTDAPRFPWRGLMLDVARHFMPLPVVYRTIDGMAAVKLNVLHLHLTDDQGFRIESKRFPRLTEFGSDGLFYTQQQMREVVAYASARGIRVVPEFDVPGHVTSWLTGMPELASVPRKDTISRTFGIWDQALDPTKESTYVFLDAFIGEMAELFPDEYLHLGGDESNGNDWKANPAIAAYMRDHGMKSTDDLQVYFSSRALDLVKKHGKQMVGWDEILQPGTPKDAVIQSWRGAESLAVAAKQGNRGILSAPYYLDAMKTAERMYLDDPLAAGAELSPEQTRLILGGEATLWAEQVTAQTEDSRIWPRTAALAERFWSPRDTRDIPDLYRRLATESIRLEAFGLTHISGPQAGLRQIAGSERGADQLAVLTAALTPASFSDRYQQQKTSQLTPMGNVVDFTRPDPPLRVHLQRLVEQYLQSGPTRDGAAHELQTLFDSWIASGPALDALAVDHPLVGGVALRRKQLVQLGQLGKDALGYIASGKAAPAAWTRQAQALLKDAELHREIVDFAVLPPMGQLVAAAGKPGSVAATQ